MGPIERAWAGGVNRREALLALGGMLSAPTVLQAQTDPRDVRQHVRVPGIGEMLESFDFEPVCYANIPRAFSDYMMQGADGEWTARRNRHAFEWVELVPGARVAPEAVDPSTEILGVAMPYPIIIAPSASQVQLHPTGEIGMYQAATATGTLMAVSQNTQTPQEEIAAVSGGPRWIQLYPSSNPESSQRTIQRYQDAGALAIIVTIDQQATRYDRADNNRRLGGEVAPPPRPNPNAARPIDFTGPRRYRLNVPDRMFYTWDALQQLQEFASVPLLIKGVTSAHDARVCVDRGFDGIVVSNHGGRSMDYVPSTLEVLEEIVQEVNGAIPVLIDSGFRRGSDVFKALALGADAVCFGRAPRWGLGAFGPAGAERLIQILQGELREAMAMTGRQNLAAIDRTAIRTDFR